jgi:hypothetical protein
VISFSSIRDIHEASGLAGEFIRVFKSFFRKSHDTSYPEKN